MDDRKGYAVSAAPAAAEFLVGDGEHLDAGFDELRVVGVARRLRAELAGSSDVGDVWLGDALDDP